MLSRRKENMALLKCVTDSKVLPGVLALLLPLAHFSSSRPPKSRLFRLLRRSLPVSSN